MGLLDDAKKKVTGLLHGHEDQAKQGIDKAADVAGSKLGDGHAEQIDSVADKAKDAVDKLAE